MINVNSETFNTTQPKSRKQIRRKSAWSTVASVLKPDMINRLKAGFKPESTQHVNFYFHTIIFRQQNVLLNKICPNTPPQKIFGKNTYVSNKTANMCVIMGLFLMKTS